MRADEIAAAEIVAAYLDGNPEARDVEGAPDKKHDFDVVLRTGQRIALEVTAAVDEARVSLDHAAFGKELVRGYPRARLVGRPLEKDGGSIDSGLPRYEADRPAA